MSTFVISWTFSSSLFFLIPAIAFGLGFIDISLESVGIILIFDWILLGLIQWQLLNPYISNARTWCLLTTISGFIMSCLLTTVIAVTTFFYSKIIGYSNDIDNLDVGYLVVLTTFFLPLFFGFLLGWRQRSILKLFGTSNKVNLIPISTSLSWLFNVSTLIIAFAVSEQKDLENYQVHIWLALVLCTCLNNLIKALLIGRILKNKSNNTRNLSIIYSQFKINFNIAKFKMSSFIYLWTFSLCLFFCIPAIIYRFSSIEGSIKSIGLILIFDWILLGLIQWLILKSYIPNAYIWCIVTIVSGITISYIWSISVFYGWFVFGITMFSNKNFSVIRSLLLLINIALFFGLGYLLGKIQLSVLGKLIVLPSTNHFSRNTGFYWLLNIPISLISSISISYKNTPFYMVLLTILISISFIISSSLTYSSKLEQILTN